jgi:maleylacetoacetate isomerase
VKLYGYFRSSAAYRVRIALNLKGLAWESEPVDLRPPANAQRSPAFLALNPQGLVPVLVDGERVITQSLAIIEYLDEVRRTPPLLPAAAADRAQVRAFALAIACDIHPLNNTRVLGYLRAQLGADEAAVSAWYAHWVTRGLHALEAQVARLGSDGRHMFGDSVTLADVCLVPQIYNARRFNCDLAPCPTLVSIGAHLETLPAFARAAPEAQPEAAA